MDTERSRRSPAELWEQLDEFLVTRLSVDPLRKMALGVGLNGERRRLLTRLLAAVPQTWDDPLLRDYWSDLYAVYRKIDQALRVPNEDELRTYGAKVIFRGEEIADEPTASPAPPPGPLWHEPEPVGGGVNGASDHH